MMIVILGLFHHFEFASSENSWILKLTYNEYRDDGEISRTHHLKKNKIRRIINELTISLLSDHGRGVYIFKKYFQNAAIEVKIFSKYCMKAKINIYNRINFTIISLWCIWRMHFYSNAQDIENIMIKYSVNKLFVQRAVKC